MVRRLASGQDSDGPGPERPPSLWQEFVDRPHELLGSGLLTCGLLGFGVDALTNPSKPSSYRALGAGSLIIGLLVVASFWLYRHPASLAGPRWQSSAARRAAAVSLRHAWSLAFPLLTAGYWLIRRR